MTKKPNKEINIKSTYFISIVNVNIKSTNLLKLFDIIIDIELTLILLLISKVLLTKPT